ncbi:MAG: 5-dehydro-4-deoxy-D-glucuronate isomerase, partial [Acidobacteriota bacterium]|nr:5-dehydro-4-deoxy-D-glucuronate isomerase [Acidobacteriota bacterium]
MKTCLSTDIVRYRTMPARELRQSFLLDALCVPGELQLAYVESDRAVVGFASPLEKTIPLPSFPQLRADHFLERRELGALNIGGHGTILVDGQAYAIDNLDCLYLGRGVRQVEFTSKDPANPAVYYLLSYPAHAAHPTTLVRKADASPMDLGSQDNANQRTVFKYIHMAGAQSCQLVMGVTHLKSGNVWNTMPP